MLGPACLGGMCPETYATNDYKIFIFYGKRQQDARYARVREMSDRRRAGAMRACARRGVGGLTGGAARPKRGRRAASGNGRQASIVLVGPALLDTTPTRLRHDIRCDLFELSSVVLYDIINVYNKLYDI